MKVVTGSASAKTDQSVRPCDKYQRLGMASKYEITHDLKQDGSPRPTHGRMPPNYFDQCKLKLTLGARYTRIRKYTFGFLSSVVNRSGSMPFKPKICERDALMPAFSTASASRTLISR